MELPGAWGSRGAVLNSSLFSVGRSRARAAHASLSQDARQVQAEASVWQHNSTWEGQSVEGKEELSNEAAAGLLDNWEDESLLGDVCPNAAAGPPVNKKRRKAPCLRQPTNASTLAMVLSQVGCMVQSQVRCVVQVSASSRSSLFRSPPGCLVPFPFCTGW